MDAGGVHLLLQQGKGVCDADFGVTVALDLRLVAMGRQGRDRVGRHNVETAIRVIGMTGMQ